MDADTVLRIKPDLTQYLHEFDGCFGRITARPSKNGGYVHVLQASEYRPPRTRRIALTAHRPSRVRDLADRAAEWQDLAARGGRLEQLSGILGVTVQSLRAFGVGFNASEHCWTWPPRDAAERIVGMNRRFQDSTKKVMPGTHVGLYIPDDLILTYHSLRTFTLLIVEGGSDAAAGHDMGLPTVGRFSCTGQQDILADLVRTVRPSVVVIVADADGPGRAGPERLARALRPLVRALKLIEPAGGLKDLRAWRQAGATDGDLIRLINEAPARPLRMEVRHA
jgi:hypothetical protein